MLPNLFINLVPKPKTVLKKNPDQYASWIEAKILNKILANRTQQYDKRIIHHDKVELISGMKDSLMFENQSTQSIIWTG